MSGANESRDSADHAVSATALPVRRVGVVGVGLIGGSVAMAVRRRGGHVVGIGRSAARLEQAAAAGVLDDYGTKASALAETDLVVVCTPVDRVAADVRAAASNTDAVLTDAGSTKATIVEACGAVPRFVGSHPMAGSEKTGWRNASADLFEGRVCVLTPTGATDAAAADRVDAFWQSLGGRTVRMSPPDHDTAVARVSHLPHFAAAALVAAAGPHTRVAAGGFRDTTRVAAGDAALWTSIARENAGPLSDALRDLSARLDAARAAIDAGQWDAIEAMLRKAADLRRAWGSEQ